MEQDKKRVILVGTYGLGIGTICESEIYQRLAQRVAEEGHELIVVGAVSELDYRDESDTLLFVDDDQLHLRRIENIPKLNASDFEIKSYTYHSFDDKKSEKHFKNNISRSRGKFKRR